MAVKKDLAFVFPGQGSQKIGMLSGFGEVDVFQSTFTEASEALGYDLWSLIQNGEQEKLNMTEITQPALLTSSIAIWRIWCDQGGVLPAYVAGHSLGEWSALVAAGVVSLSDAVKLVQLRGRYMQEAVPAGKGAMAAIIGLDDSAVEEICARAEKESGDGEVCSAVNYNSPGQLVIAGTVAAVEYAISACKEAGAKRALPLPVSAPFHTSLMKPAAERLSLDIQSVRFSSPQIPVVHNVSAKAESSPEAIQKLMIEQVYSAVQWVDCVKFLANENIVQALELGPGKVLSGLIKRIDKRIVSMPSETPTLLDDALASLSE